MIPDIPDKEWRPEIVGWSHDILPFYDRVARECQADASLVEVGVCHGRSLVYLAERLGELGKLSVRLTGVDSWVGGLWPHQIEHTLRMLPPDHAAHAAILQRGDGVESAVLFDDQSLDMVFIDSDHSYEGMVRHLEAWPSKVKSGGIVAGHDYDPSAWPGVFRAVNEWCARRGHKLLRPTSTVWEVRL